MKELRLGYTWRGRVIRCAEVQAVRSGLAVPPAGTLDGQSSQDSLAPPIHREKGQEMGMQTIIGIDLGTTNSEVAVIKDGRAIVLEADGEAILPSVVGLDLQGNLLVGKAAPINTCWRRNGRSARSSGRWATR